MNVNTNTNYLTNSLAAVQKFVKSAANELRSDIYQSKYGFGSKSGSVLSSLKNIASNPQKVVATAVSDFLTDSSLKNVWKYTNVSRMAGDIGKRVAETVGMDPVTGATLGKLAPLTLLALSNVRGPLQQGLRPLGYKAVAPVSKEKDPTGRTSQSSLLEATLRYGLGQRSQMLPYNEFKKERPDVAPSTYTQYRRYENFKPQPGKLTGIDPEGQSFTTIGGLVRGTAKGLNDPEIRIKGIPITASGVIGTAAGLGASALVYSALPEAMKRARYMEGPDVSPATVKQRKGIEEQLSGARQKQATGKQIIERVTNKLTELGVTPEPRYQQPSEKALHRGKIYDKIDSEISKISYRIKKTLYPDSPIELGPTGTNIIEELRGLPPGSILPKEYPKADINELLSRVYTLEKRKERIVNSARNELKKNVPSPEVQTLENRLSRAKRYTSEAAGQVGELDEAMRKISRPVLIGTPSTATVAGISALGVGTAIAAGYATKKLFQKAAERRIKKENPVEYLKQKHGSLEQASAALGLPQAQSWQQLVPHIQ